MWHSQSSKAPTGGALGNAGLPGEALRNRDAPKAKSVMETAEQEDRLVVMASSWHEGGHILGNKGGTDLVSGLQVTERSYRAHSGPGVWAVLGPAAGLGPQALVASVRICLAIPQTGCACALRLPALSGFSADGKPWEFLQVPGI